MAAPGLGDHTASPQRPRASGTSLRGSHSPINIPKGDAHVSRIMTVGATRLPPRPSFPRSSRHEDGQRGLPHADGHPNAHIHAASALGEPARSRKNKNFYFFKKKFYSLKGIRSQLRPVTGRRPRSRARAATIGIHLPTFRNVPAGPTSEADVRAREDHVNDQPPNQRTSSHERGAGDTELQNTKPKNKTGENRVMNRR